jgi:hypothetical protein
MKRRMIEIDVERIRPNLRLIYQHEIIEGMCRWIQSGERSTPFKCGLTVNASASGDGRETVEGLQNSRNHPDKSAPSGI